MLTVLRKKPPWKMWGLDHEDRDLKGFILAYKSYNIDMVTLNVSKVVSRRVHWKDSITVTEDECSTRYILKVCSLIVYPDPSLES